MASSKEAAETKDVGDAAAGLHVEPLEHDLFPALSPWRKRPDRNAMDLEERV